MILDSSRQIAEDISQYKIILNIIGTNWIVPFQTNERKYIPGAFYQIHTSV